MYCTVSLYMHVQYTSVVRMLHSTVALLHTTYDSFLFVMSSFGLYFT